jgi:hypothetical protein
MDITISRNGTRRGGQHQYRQHGSGQCPAVLQPERTDDHSCPPLPLEKLLEPKLDLDRRGRPEAVSQVVYAERAMRASRSVCRPLDGGT